MQHATGNMQHATCDNATRQSVAAPSRSKVVGRLHYDGCSKRWRVRQAHGLGYRAFFLQRGAAAMYSTFDGIGPLCCTPGMFGVRVACCKFYVSVLWSRGTFVG